MFGTEAEEHRHTSFRQQCIWYPRLIHTRPRRFAQSSRAGQGPQVGPCRLSHVCARHPSLPTVRPHQSTRSWTRPPMAAKVPLQPSRGPPPCVVSAIQAFGSLHFIPSSRSSARARMASACEFFKRACTHAYMHEHGTCASTLAYRYFMCVRGNPAVLMPFPLYLCMDFGALGSSAIDTRCGKKVAIKKITSAFDRATPVRQVLRGKLTLMHVITLSLDTHVYVIIVAIIHNDIISLWLVTVFACDGHVDRNQNPAAFQ